MPAQRLARLPVRERSAADRPAPLRRMVPNAISLLRVPLAVLFVFVGVPAGRVGVVALAALSDVADGAIARRTGRTTRAGELLDPVADRIFMATVFLALAVERSIPGWTLPLLLLRDIGVTAGALLLLTRGGIVRMPARAPGKRVTLLQLIAAGLVVLEPRAAPFVAAPIGLLGAIAVRDYVRACSALRGTGAAGAGPGMSRPGTPPPSS